RCGCATGGGANSAVVARSSSYSCGPRASRSPHDDERAGRSRSGRHDESGCLHCQHAPWVAAQWVAESAASAGTPAHADSINVSRKLRKVRETSGTLRKPLRHALPACGSARSVKIEMVEMGSANCANCANPRPVLAPPSACSRGHVLGGDALAFGVDLAQ